MAQSIRVTSFIDGITLQKSDWLNQVSHFFCEISNEALTFPAVNWQEGFVGLQNLAVNWQGAFVGLQNPAVSWQEELSPTFWVK